MRSLARLAIVLGTVVIFSGFLSIPLRADEYDPLFVKAVQLEQQGKKQDALNEYHRIVREKQADPEAAAEGLYRGGLYALDRYGTTPDEKKQGEDAAVQMWKQLEQEYSGTRAAAKLNTPAPGAPDGRWAALEHTIDQRNSGDWKYQILNTLVVLTGRNPSYSYALALILLAVLVKLILLPLTKKQYAGMREMQRMQPLIKDLQKKYKGSELSQKTMELYKEHGVNPFASCLPTLLQLPFLFLIFAAIREYEFAFAHGKFLWIGSALANHSPRFMGHPVFAPNLSSPDIPLLALYTLTNYVTMRMTPATDPQQQQQQSMMALLTSGFFFFMFIQYRWSSAFVLYWLALNFLSIWQQYEYVYKPHKGNGGATPMGGDMTAPGVIANGQNGSGAAPVDARPIGSSATPARVRPRKKKR